MQNSTTTYNYLLGLSDAITQNRTPSTALTLLELKPVFVLVEVNPDELIEIVVVVLPFVGRDCVVLVEIALIEEFELPPIPVVFVPPKMVVIDVTLLLPICDESVAPTMLDRTLLRKKTNINPRTGRIIRLVMYQYNEPYYHSNNSDKEQYDHSYHTPFTAE